MEWRWLKTGKRVYEEIYRMWVKIFAVTFDMGVVSGVVMSYQFGTQWFQMRCMALTPSGFIAVLAGKNPAAVLKKYGTIYKIKAKC